MIDPHDLMLDNWLLDPEGKPIVYEAIRPMGPPDRRRHVLNGMHYADECNPIPLTLELIEKLGWPVAKTQWGSEFSIAARTTIVFGTDSTVFVAPGTTVENIQYLHALQNHYRLATGKKLEVKL